MKRLLLICCLSLFIIPTNSFAKCREVFVDDNRGGHYETICDEEKERREYEDEQEKEDQYYDAECMRGNESFCRRDRRDD